jgi:hypothetical protein
MAFPLVIAVSMRFSHPLTDCLYSSVIEPQLLQYGTLLRCDFASNSPDDLDYWMNRMNVILDLADIHVFIDIDRTASTQYEFQGSSLCCLLGAGRSLFWNFGLESSETIRPYQIIIYRHSDGTYRLRGRGPGKHLSLGRRDTGERIESGLLPALTDIANTIQQTTPTDYFRKKYDIAHLFVNDAAVLNHDNGGAHRSEILAYNRRLQKLTALFSKAAADDSVFYERTAYAKAFCELFYLVWTRGKSSAEAEADLRTFRGRLIVLVLSLLGLKRFNERFISSHFAQKVPPQGIAAKLRRLARITFKETLARSVPTLLLLYIFVTVPFVKEYLSQHRVFAGYVGIGLALSTYDICVSWWARIGQPLDSPRWFLWKFHPARRWPMRIYAVLVMVGAVGWISSYITSAASKLLFK